MMDPIQPGDSSAAAANTADGGSVNDNRVSSNFADIVGLGLSLDQDPADRSLTNNTDFAQFLHADPERPYEDVAFGHAAAPSILGNTSTADLVGGDFALFKPTDDLDPFDPALFMNGLSQNTSDGLVNTTVLAMSASQAQGPASPGLLQPHSQSPGSAHQSPAFNQTHFPHSSPSHSRNASLGPESAAFPQAQGSIDWTMMAPQFQGHRRTPSEYSDVSSAAHSPHILTQDSFEALDPSHSPMQRPQADSNLYNEVLGIGAFSLSDPQLSRGATPGQGLSPAHSPAISPRLSPQPGSSLNPTSTFLLGMHNGMGMQPAQLYGNIRPEAGARTHSSNPSLDMGQAAQMIPPEINVEFAPTSRQNTIDANKPSFDQDALTPPDRGRRRRAVSDPYNSATVLSRPVTPASMSSGSELSVRSADLARSLSPNDRLGAASPSRRRQSTSSLPNRDYILGLADPDYASSNAENGNSRRVQKHPATFQCTLCPKRFTRAYNLRSHLRTHTDERPFVCTVCGKAFARQHDRKRHEGLHSGEKKFVCKGELKQGGHWGCSRRFARADALGRHFRSEAGRICIKPLLDEEAIERQRLWQEQRLQNMPLTVDATGFSMDPNNNYALPAALLAQYPALATMNWQQGEDDPSGRSSFDASGSEYYDEADESGYLSSGPGPQQSFGQVPAVGSYGRSGYSSDIGGQ